MKGIKLVIVRSKKYDFILDFDVEKMTIKAKKLKSNKSLLFLNQSLELGELKASEKSIFRNIFEDKDIYSVVNVCLMFIDRCVLIHYNDVNKIFNARQQARDDQPIPLRQLRTAINFWIKKDKGYKEVDRVAHTVEFEISFNSKLLRFNFRTLGGDTLF
ncbi:uncharacterized protein N7515_007135 [Penicillium bovifimosum]|uniref:Uncharacterized protein n=1 Tax=Penicillium bovifimosum TaxID=126998 RepID=A0A9W9GXB1_9EURO|nr:uncharacterized protein N7515_007135 [Penicillium bovifimosum]KAJ5131096.1 hypothetical protein N7515_007135 [Penicillium bovifimosum]